VGPSGRAWLFIVPVVATAIGIGWFVRDAGPPEGAPSDVRARGEGSETSPSPALGAAREANDVDVEARRTATRAGGGPTAEQRAWVAQAVASLDGSPRSVRIDTLQKLGSMGPAAATAVEALVARLATDDVQLREQCAYVLRAIGAPALEALMTAAGSDDERVRAGAVLALGSWAGERGVATVLAAHADLSAEVRAAAARASPWHEALVDARLALLSDPVSRVREVAARSLAFDVGGEAGHRLAAALAARLGDLHETEAVRMAAAAALARHVRTPDVAVAALEQAVRGDAVLVAKSALEALPHLGPAGVAAIPLLLSIAERGDDLDRPLAALALLEIAPGDPRVRDLFRRWLASDEDDDLRSTALRGLIHAGPDSVEFLRSVAEARPDLRILREAVWIAPSDRAFGAAIAALRACLDVAALRALAIASLASVGEPAKEAAPALVRLLKTGTPDDRWAAVGALSAIAGGLATPDIVRAATDPEPKVRAHAMHVLGHLDTASALVLDAISARLLDPDAGVREEAVTALASLAERLPDAEARLRSAARDLAGHDVGERAAGRVAELERQRARTRAPGRAR
jgi:HEAT repeat protein